MKKTLPILIVACAGLAAVGCDPAPKDEPSSTPTSTKTDAPMPSAPSGAKPTK